MSKPDLSILVGRTIVHADYDVKYIPDLEGEVHMLTFVTHDHKQIVVDWLQKTEDTKDEQ